MPRFLEERGYGSKEIGIVVVLFFLGVAMKVYASLAYESFVVEKRIIINGVSKDSIDFVTPYGRTLFNLTGDACLTLCFSLIVSLFFIKGIEDSLAAKRAAQLDAINAEIRENVFSSVFRTLVDEEIFEIIKRDIIKNGMVRKDIRWTYDFVELPNGNISLRQTDRYHLYNGTGADRTEQIIAVCDDASGVAFLKEFICRQDDKPVLSFKYDELVADPDNPRQKTACDGKVVVTESGSGGSEVLISFPILRGGTVQISQVYETAYNVLPINDSFFTRYPVVNATLEANFPAGYDFHVFSSLASELVPDPLLQENRRSYRAQGGILPNQGFVFTLKKITA
ncbi:hypothetical protein [Hymenobacter yonginensis]|uniref:Uncharacterized protein n=1 Tax=Hymenobacter yonginensis TaxID=748197 RepID=A0ABY7PK25_9BACT|nr:hypothetical protein [Hymenobacter yonginensis]WBO83615.1 hypothetical protein O9Z63_14660 [Hymenobacter yonginensis]